VLRLVCFLEKKERSCEPVPISEFVCEGMRYRRLPRPRLPGEPHDLARLVIDELPESLKNVGSGSFEAFGMGLTLVRVVHSTLCTSLS